MTPWSTQVHVARAQAKRAVQLARWRDAGPSGARFTRHVAMGDPQADADRVLAVLAAHRLLGDDGWLAPDVQLVSIGDHFDWRCDPTDQARDEAGRSGLELLAWLASHPTDQVVLILGNHDLGRVGELARFDDASFRRARALADRAYDHQTQRTDPAAEERLWSEFPDVPTAELLARDFSSFLVEQRALVTDLLRAGRFRVAHAHADDLLLCHAGVTRRDLDDAGLSRPAHVTGEAERVAAALNAALDRAVAAWQGGPLALPSGLHQPGTRGVEGTGIFYHRPLNPEKGAMDDRKHEAERQKLAERRRFDPRQLPRGIVQVIGHVGDSKCRELLGPWCDGKRAKEGILRHLVLEEASGNEAIGARYRAGAGSWTTVTADAPAAPLTGLVFIDGTLSGVTAPPGEGYELLDFDTRQRAER